MNRILIVEDDKDISRELKELLENSGYEAVVLTDFKNACDSIIAAEPDLVLLDINIPYMNGEMLLQQLRSKSDVPVIMVTSRDSEADEVLSMSYGADDYITKPFDVEVLRSKVNSLLKRRDEMRRFYTSNSVGAHPEGEKTVKKDDSPSNLFMDAVISTIEKHLDDPSFEAKILADSLNMSLPTLYRKIKLYSDSSILELTRMVRLKKAAELISMQRYSIQEVSEMVGFNDTATFRKRFTEQYGVTPSQYLPGKN